MRTKEIAQAIKEHLVKLTLNDEIPMDMNELSVESLEEVIEKFEEDEDNNEQFSIDTVTVYTTEKQYSVEGENIPLQIIKYEEISDWHTVVNDKGEPVFDVQLDFDEEYNFQYVNLIKREDDLFIMGHDWRNPKNLIINL